jgi:hypothetical protein
MSGRDVLNANQTGPMQLPMFMRATDLRESLTGTLDTPYEHPDEVMKRKLGESKRSGSSHGAGVHSSVSKQGVLNPVQLVHGVKGGLLSGQGHHRIAAAADIAQSSGRDMWVPLVHTDAREGTRTPISAIYSESSDRRRVVADHRKFIEHTPGLGQDIQWGYEKEQG